MELCIASDVTTLVLSLNKEDLRDCIGLDPVFSIKDEEVEIRINSEELVKFRQKLDNRISISLPSLKEEIMPGASYSSLFYKGEYFRINYRKHTHYVISILVSIDEMFEKVIGCGGVLYIFNKSLVDKFRNASVISLLKIHNGLTLEDIARTIKSLSNEFSSVEPASISEVEYSVNFLKSLGFVDFEDKKIKLTAKGYMLVL